ncbi:hypothetical protein C900_05725 [Fulvivirga imtechensis AK7]|uniref:Uncharacterized protein n=1 Tax=Fulvivirga imtechensis AK7 TaxID=1237149 RepID=L8JWC2_9BACT|nr:hypothetical protein C900_05725 [Fulvivirga imtechensis AK7]
MENKSYTLFRECKRDFVKYTGLMIKFDLQKINKGVRAFSGGFKR